jgi:maltose alpha-D-glucosyltransferase/alpha-amylase
MQWSGGHNAGFSSADPERLWLPLVANPVFGYQAVNVDAQRRNGTSLLYWMQRMIHVRKASRPLGRGGITFLAPANHRVLAFTRSLDDETVLIVHNLSSTAQCVELDLAPFDGAIPVEMFGGSIFPRVTPAPYILTLSPYGMFWFRLRWL